MVLDDGTDVSRAVKNMRKLTSEDRSTPSSAQHHGAALAGLDVLAETGTPMIALAASSVIVEPLSDPKRAWAFKMPQNDSLMATALVQDMKKKGLKNVAFIGFADSYGDSWWKEFSAAAGADLKIVAGTLPAHRRSVMGQVLKLIAAKPDAVLIAGAGTPSALPQKTLLERGYGGVIYQTHGIGTLEFLQVGGKDVEGTLFPTGPGVVARELPIPIRSSRWRSRSRTSMKPSTAPTLTQFAGDAYGAWMLLDSAVARALKGAQARHAGIPQGAARRVGVDPRPGRAQRRVQHFQGRPPGLRRACARDGRGQERPFLLRRAIRTRLVAIPRIPAAALGGAQAGLGLLLFI